jgi:hypothetical protein
MELENNQNEAIELPVHWPLEVDLPSLPANHFAVNVGADIVHIVFGECRPLITKDLSPKAIELAREHDGIQIKPLASIVVTPNGHKVLIRLLISALETDDLEEIAEHIQKTQERKQE